jgi:hypothetical protein
MDHAKKIVEVTMEKKLLACAVGALGLMLTTSIYEPAEAKHGGHSGGSGHSSSGMSHSYRVGAPFAKHAYAKPMFVKKAHFFKHKHVFRHHKRFIVAGYNDYGYADECYWLKRKALHTGGSYWWNRYYACVNGY